MENNLIKKMKEKQLQEELENEKLKKIEIAMQKEIDAVTKPIKDKYASKLKNAFNKSKTMHNEEFNIRRKLMNYWNFNLNDFNKIITELIYYYENIEYIPLTINARNNYQLEEFIHIYAKDNILVKKSAVKNVIRYISNHNNIINSFDYEINNGNIILIGEAEDYDKTIINLYNFFGTEIFEFSEEYEYIKEFINELINARAMMDKEEITLEELKSFKINFIKNHPIIEKDKTKKEKIMNKKN